jgi:hypothetical protein
MGHNDHEDFVPECSCGERKNLSPKKCDRCGDDGFKCQACRELEGLAPGEHDGSLCDYCDHMTSKDD